MTDLDLPKRSCANSGRDRRVGGLDSKQQLLWLGAKLLVISQLRRQLPQSANQMNAFHQRLHRNFSSRRKYEHLSLLLKVSDFLPISCLLLAGNSQQQPRAISTQDPVPVKVQSRAASNGKEKLDQSQEILSLITRKQPKQFRPCPRVLLAVYQCHKRYGGPCILLITPANRVFSLQIKADPVSNDYPYDGFPLCARLDINSKKASRSEC
jgi:hypothetical protein